MRVEESDKLGQITLFLCLGHKQKNSLPFFVPDMQKIKLWASLENTSQPTEGENNDYSFQAFQWHLLKWLSQVWSPRSYEGLFQVGNEVDQGAPWYVLIALQPSFEMTWQETRFGSMSPFTPRSSITCTEGRASRALVVSLSTDNMRFFFLSLSLFERDMSVNELFQKEM